MVGADRSRRPARGRAGATKLNSGSHAGYSIAPTEIPRGQSVTGDHLGPVRTVFRRRCNIWPPEGGDRSPITPESGYRLGLAPKRLANSICHWPTIHRLRQSPQVNLQVLRCPGDLRRPPRREAIEQRSRGQVSPNGNRAPTELTSRLNSAHSEGIRLIGEEGRRPRPPAILKLDRTVDKRDGPGTSGTTARGCALDHRARPDCATAEKTERTWHIRFHSPWPTDDP